MKIEKKIRPDIKVNALPLDSLEIIELEFELEELKNFFFKTLDLLAYTLKARKKHYST